MSIMALNERARAILRQLVDLYVATGEPVGSRTLAKAMGLALSPASIRNSMADLEGMGLLAAPHSSAGRVPTEAGLRLFVDGLLEIGDLQEEERAAITRQCAGTGQSVTTLLEEASRTLAGLTHCAGLVVAPQADAQGLRQIEFVNLGGNRVLVVLVTQDGMVENRMLELAEPVAPASLQQAANYLNARLAGRKLADVQTDVEAEIAAHRSQLDALTASVVQRGLAVWGGEPSAGQLIVRGQDKLLEDVTALADLERIRQIFSVLESREATQRLLQSTQHAGGVQIFIGAQSPLFSHAGCSLIVAPYARGTDDTGAPQIIGAIGVIGPTRLNYARIIPMVDYTAALLSRMLQGDTTTDTKTG